MERGFPFLHCVCRGTRTPIVADPTRRSFGQYVPGRDKTSPVLALSLLNSQARSPVLTLLPWCDFGVGSSECGLKSPRHVEMRVCFLRLMAEPAHPAKHDACPALPSWGRQPPALGQPLSDPNASFVPCQVGCQLVPTCAFPFGRRALLARVWEVRSAPPRRAIECAFASLGRCGVWRPL